MKYIKKIAVIILALALMVQPLSGTKSLAAANDGISALSATTDYMAVHLEIDRDGATNCIADVYGFSGTTKIAGTLTLKKGTTTVKSWNVSTSSQKLRVSKTCYLLSKGTYKLTLKVKVTCDGKSETLSCSTTGTY